MQLKNELYRIIDCHEQESATSYTLALNPNSFIYQAHFPGEPITPGVCIVQTAKELTEEHLQRPLTIKVVKNVKFLSVLSPVDAPMVVFTLAKLNIAEAERMVKVQVVVSVGDAPKAKISMVLAY